MNLLDAFRKIQFYARIFDWIAACAVLGYGIYDQNKWWLVAGGILLLVAWLNPAERIRRYFSIVKPARKRSR